MDRLPGLNGMFSTILVEHENKNAAAIAWVEQWYATPDDQLPGYWDAFEELLKAHPIDFGTPLDAPMA